MHRCLIILTSLIIIWRPNNGYNLDTKHPIIFEDPGGDNGYFGYSLVLSEKWLKVGAPKATYHVGKAIINQSGLVYHCSLREKCKVQTSLNFSANYLEHSMTGGAMDISYKYNILGISSNTWILEKDISRGHIPGGVFLENLQNEKIMKSYRPLDKPEVLGEMPYYARALAGFSLHFIEDEDEVLVGAPGVYSFLGTVFRIKNIHLPQGNWSYTVFKPQGHYDEYSGYAITSGRFYWNSGLHYVTALPRGFSIGSRKILNNALYGSVVIFRFTSSKIGPKFPLETLARIKQDIFGTQIGEYFGASLAVGDLNSDGLDDLIVGAPFRCNDHDGFNHGSVYVFFGNKINGAKGHLKYDSKFRLDGTENGGQFGLALMVLGDMDHDGYPELGISAPYEEETGAVYIYSFNKITRTMKMTQKILGKELHPSLKGFGFCFSRPTDIDNNGHSDVAIGSAISGHAIILRSKPVVTVYASIRAPSNMSKSNMTLYFQCCYFLSGSPNLTIRRKLIVDQDLKRFTFPKNFTFNHTEEKRIIITENYEKCEHIFLKKIRKFNLDSPVRIQLTYNLSKDSSDHQQNTIVIRPNGQAIKDIFCKTCPQLSKKSETNKMVSIILDHMCDHNGINEPCQAQLEIHARFLNLSRNNTFILGSDELVLEIRIENKGDPAYLPALQIVLPEGVDLKATSIDCDQINKTIKCEGEEVLSEKILKFLLRFNVHLEQKNDINFALIVTANVNDSSHSNLTLKLERDVDLLLTGYSNEANYVHKRGTYLHLENIFKIEKFGLSRIPQFHVKFIIPHKIKSFDGSWKQLTKIQTKNNPFVECNRNFTIFKQDLMKLSNSFVNFYSNSTYYLNCTIENIECVIMNCTISNMENYADIFLQIEANFDLLEDVKNIDQIVLSIQAVAFVKEFQQSGNR
ncbi:hypothetical protein ABEB36_002536 [Hypothenemus hampei]